MILCEQSGRDTGSAYGVHQLLCIGHQHLQWQVCGHFNAKRVAAESASVALAAARPPTVIIQG